MNDANFKAVEEILGAISHRDQRESLKHWDKLVPYAAPTMYADQGEVQYVEHAYEILRSAAFQWFVNYRFKDLYARLAALEEHTGLRDSS